MKQVFLGVGGGGGLSAPHSGPLSPVATSERLRRQAQSQAWRPVAAPWLRPRTLMDSACMQRRLQLLLTKTNQQETTFAHFLTSE